MCGYQGATLTFILTKEFKKIFGGYTDIPWGKQTPKMGLEKYGNRSSFIFKIKDDNSI